MSMLFHGVLEDWTEESKQVDNAFRAALTPVFQKFLDEGYSVRELAYIAFASVDMVQLRTLALKVRTARRNNSNEEDKHH